MRISDWSSDVCSSDLPERIVCPRAGRDQLSLGRGLEVRPAKRQDALKTAVLVEDHARRDERRPRQVIGEPLGALAILAEEHHDPAFRSEEHTSELQSLMRISYALFCLKNTTNIQHRS